MSDRLRRRIIRWFAARLGVCRCTQMEFCTVCSQRMRELSHGLPATSKWCRRRRVLYPVGSTCPDEPQIANGEPS